MFKNWRYLEKYTSNQINNDPRMTTEIIYQKTIQKNLYYKTPLYFNS